MGRRGPLRAERPSEPAAACASQWGAGSTTQALPRSSATNTVTTLSVMGLSTCNATSSRSLGSRYPSSAKRTCALSEKRWRCCPVVRAPELIPALQRRGGERTLGPRTEQSASRSQRLPLPNPRLSIQHEQRPSQPVTSPPSALAIAHLRAHPLRQGRAARTPAAVTNQHAPPPRRGERSRASARGRCSVEPGEDDATAWSCGRLGDALGATHGRSPKALCEERLVSLRNQHGYPGLDEHWPKDGLMRGAAGFLAEPARLRTSSMAPAPNALPSPSGLPCGPRCP